jgi:uncharacterized membrane protein (DUF373 family)
MTRILEYFERIIVTALIVMLGIVILLTTIELGRIIILNLISPMGLLLDVTMLLDIFGFILLVLIGIELLETMKAYFEEHIVHVEVVLEVALIAVARKVIIMDVKELSAQTVLAVAGLLLALAIGYFLEKRARQEQVTKLTTSAE